jgi:hypothetical protein
MTPIVPVTYAVQGEKSSPPFARSFALGCRGTAIPHDRGLQPGPMAAFGTPPTWPLFDACQARGDDWYYGDHGLFRRFRYYRITKNQLQHDGRGKAGEKRWLDLHVDLNPGWNTEGTSIVICPNSAIYMARFGLDARQWAVDLVQQLQGLTDRPVIVRWKTQSTARPLYVDLHNAYMVVAFSSAATIEALAAGVAVCTLAPWASTARMGITSIADVNRPYYPDIGERDQFLFNLANQQWTLPEIEAGLAWKTLNT